MRVIRMADLGCSSGRTSGCLNSFSGFVMDDGEWNEFDEATEELLEEVVQPVAVPVVGRATRLLQGTRC